MANPLVTCPHCKRDFVSNTYKKHAATCINNPEIRERMIRMVTDRAVDGRAMTMQEYEIMAKQYGLPGIKPIKSAFGSWLQFLDAIDLVSVRMNYNRDEVSAEMVRLSNLYHDGVIGPSPKEWDLYRTITTTSQYIIILNGTWKAALEGVGLVRAGQGYYQRQYAERSHEWQAINKRQNQINTGQSDHANSFSSPFPFQAIDRGVRTWFDRTTHTTVTAHVLELR